MLVQEQHIDFNIKLQKIDSNNYDTFLPEEIDWLLNTAQYRFVKHRMSKSSNRRQEGADDTYKRYQDLQALITRVDLPVYQDDSLEYFFGFLPTDFFDIRNARSYGYKDCNGFDDINISQETRTIAVLPFPNDNAASNLFDQFVINGITTSGTNVLFDLMNYPTIVGGGQFQINQQKYIIVSHVLEIINRRKDVQVYWEYYGKDYYPNSFILISDSDYATYEMYYVGYSNTVVANTLDLLIYSDDIDKPRNTGHIRFVETEDLYDILDHPFAKTIADHPVGTFRGRELQVYNNEKFILNKVQIDYIRKPRLISLSLDQHCELPESRHGEIVDIAVQLASAYIGSDVHRNIINENLLSD